jgi:hypothetical protein
MLLFWLSTERRMKKFPEVGGFLKKFEVEVEA